MKSMTLAEPGGLENLMLHEGEPPSPREGEVLVRVHASSLNYHDYFVVTGQSRTADGRVPMSDGAGIVVAVGAGVTEFAPGDAVVSTFFSGRETGTRPSFDAQDVPGDGMDGFAAEWAARPVRAFTRAPANLSHREAATLPCAALTAWRALVVEGGIKAGDVVLVQGTGGVSIFALQFAKMFGAQVVATSSSDEKLARLRSLGADHVINYRRDPDWGRSARDIAGGGVDHVVEVGGAGTLGSSIMAARPGGHISIIGVLAGVAGEVPTALVMAKQLRLIGIAVGARHHQQDMIRAIEANNLHPVLDRDFPLAELADAFRYQESGKHFGKITISM